MLESLHSARLLADDPGDLGHTEPTHDPQQDHLALGVGELVEEPEDGVGLDLVHGLALSRIDRFESSADLIAFGGIGRAPTPTSALIDDAVMAHHEHPRPEVVVVAFEPGNTPGYVKPGLTGEVIDVRGALLGQISP